MKVVEENVLDTGRGFITVTGAIYGFKKYAEHECLVLVFQNKKTKPMDKELVESTTKALEKKEGCKVTKVEFKPYGATDSGVPGTVFHMENGRKIWLAHEEERGCLDFEKNLFHYCMDCPWGLLPESKECKKHIADHGRKFSIG